MPGSDRLRHGESVEWLVPIAESGCLDLNRVYIRLFPLHSLLSYCARQSDTEVVSAKHQAWPRLAVHVFLDRTLEMGATEMGATIGCPLVGESPRGTETTHPLRVIVDHHIDQNQHGTKVDLSAEKTD